MRLHITGNAGAGKTTLAREMSARYDLPLLHLDSVVWQSGWRKTPEADKAAKVRQLVQGEQWLIEGVSDIVRANADLVVFIDAPRWLCLYRCVRRSLRLGRSTRPELPADCPEIRILFRAVSLVWRFPGVVGNTIRAEADARGYLVAESAAHARQLIDERLQTWSVAAKLDVDGVTSGVSDG